MRVLSTLLRLSPGRVAVAVAAGLLGGASAAGLIVVINTALNSSTPRNTLLWGFIGLACVMLTSNVGAQILLIRLAQGTIMELRLQLSRRILAAPLRQLEQIGAHRLLPALTDDVVAIADALQCIPTLCINIATVTVCLSYLGWLSPLVLLLVLAVLSLGVLSFQLIMHRAQQHLRSAREEQDALFRHFRGLMEGTKELKLHRSRRLAFFERLLEPTTAALGYHNSVGMSLFTAANGWGESLFFVSIGLLIFAAPAFQSIDRQVLTGTALTILYMKTALDVTMSMLPRLSRARIVLAKIDALGLSLAAHDSEDAQISQPIAGHAGADVRLRGVTHVYHREGEDGVFSLGPIDLTMQPGELVFLVGGNGSGKTTLAKMIVGLYAPEAGTITLNGQPISDENRDWYRQHFSAVFVDFYLFEQLLGLDTPELDAQARAYLAQLQLSHKITIQQGVLSTTELSQGQRKRLALLTAYLEDRPLYVFDEWASDQDPLFKEIFYTQLLPTLKQRGKTVLVITHDDRYFQVADRVIKLNYGQLDAHADQPAMSVAQQ